MEAQLDLARTPEQLPESAVPSAYAIDIVTGMARLRLTGHESIAPAASTATDSIILNQAGLKHSAATLDGIAKAALPAFGQMRSWHYIEAISTNNS